MSTSSITSCLGRVIRLIIEQDTKQYGFISIIEPIDLKEQTVFFTAYSVVGSSEYRNPNGLLEKTGLVVGDIVRADIQAGNPSSKAKFKALRVSFVSSSDSETNAPKQGKVTALFDQYGFITFGTGKNVQNAYFGKDNVVFPASSKQILTKYLTNGEKVMLRVQKSEFPGRTAEFFATKVWKERDFPEEPKRAKPVQNSSLLQHVLQPALRIASQINYENDYFFSDDEDSGNKQTCIYVRKICNAVGHLKECGAAFIICEVFLDRSIPVDVEFTQCFNGGRYIPYPLAQHIGTSEVLHINMWEAKIGENSYIHQVTHAWFGDNSKYKRYEMPMERFLAINCLKHPPTTTTDLDMKLFQTGQQNHVSYDPIPSYSISSFPENTNRISLIDSLACLDLQPSALSNGNANFSRLASNSGNFLIGATSANYSLPEPGGSVLKAIKESGVQTEPRLVTRATQTVSTGVISTHEVYHGDD